MVEPAFRRALQFGDIGTGAGDREDKAFPVIADIFGVLVEMVGDIIDSYRLLHECGTGAYGTVFRAENDATGEIVALKVLYMTPGKPKP